MGTLLGVELVQAAPCPKGKKKCKTKCIAKNQCCTNANCRPAATHKICRRGRCQCGPGFKPCQARCIPQASCCTDAQCGPGGVCRDGTCCPIGTAAALQAALQPGGPTTIQLCPNTIYTGTFTINRNVTIVGSGPTSSVLNGGGTGPVVTVTDSVTQAALAGLGITNGRSANEAGGLLNRGQLTLTDTDLVGNIGSRGGALDNQGEATLTRCRVTTSSADLGGGIRNAVSAQLSLVNCDLTGNTANMDGGGLNNAGVATLDNCRLTANTAKMGGGGGIINVGGTLTLQNGTVVGGSGAAANRAPSGAGVLSINLGATLTVTASDIIGNIATTTAVSGVGGLQVTFGASPATFTNASTVRSNQPCDCNVASDHCGTICGP